MRAWLIAVLAFGAALAWGWSAWGFVELTAEVVASDPAARTLTIRKQVGGRTWEVTVRLAGDLEARSCRPAERFREGDRVVVFYQEFRGQHLAAVVAREAR